MGKKKDKQRLKLWLDQAEHWDVLEEAMAVYEDRNQIHQGLWKENSLEEGSLHIASKAKRFARDPKNCMDDGIDLINYVVFQIRNIRSGRV